MAVDGSGAPFGLARHDTGKAMSQENVEIVRQAFARNDPQEFIDADDYVVVPAVVSGTGKRSGAPVEVAFTFLLTVQDDQIRMVRNLPDKADALRAAGVLAER
jgi:ketosteroid isomerase-like protein